MGWWWVVVGDGGGDSVFKHLIDSFWVSHHTPSHTHLLIPSYPSSDFETPQKKTNKQSILVVEAVMCPPVYPFATYLLLANVYCNAWSSSKPLASATSSILEPHLDFSGFSYCCTVSRRSYSFGSAGPGVSHASVVHRWGRFRGGPIQSSGSGLG